MFLLSQVSVSASRKLHASSSSAHHGAVWELALPGRVAASGSQKAGRTIQQIASSKNTYLPAYLTDETSMASRQFFHAISTSTGACFAFYSQKMASFFSQHP